MTNKVRDTARARARAEAKAGVGSSSHQGGSGKRYAQEVNDRNTQAHNVGCYTFVHVPLLLKYQIGPGLVCSV
jgi:hypothetical protein